MNQEMGIVRQMHKRKAGRRADDRDYGAHPSITGSVQRESARALHGLHRLPSICVAKLLRVLHVQLLRGQGYSFRGQLNLYDAEDTSAESSYAGSGDWCVGAAGVSRQLLRREVWCR